MAYTFTSNIPYGSDSLQFVNAYMQTGATLGTIIRIHGGSWRSSNTDPSPTTSTSAMVTLATAGWTVIDVNYRGWNSDEGSNGNGQYPNSVEDVKTVLEYCLESGTGSAWSPFWQQAYDYFQVHGLPIVTGNSAGGHLAVQAVCEYGTYSNRWPQAVMTRSAPLNLDFNSIFIDSLVQPVITNWVTTSTLLDDASPFTQYGTSASPGPWFTAVNASPCRFYFTHNTYDTLVTRANMAEPTIDRFDTYNAAKTFVTYDTVGPPQDSWSGTNTNVSFIGATPDGSTATLPSTGQTLGDCYQVTTGTNQGFWVYNSGTFAGDGTNPASINGFTQWFVHNYIQSEEAYIAAQAATAVEDIPQADFTVSTSTGTAPLTVTFTDISTNGPTSWAWDIDNNGSTNYTTQNPSHTYTSTGTYAVKLTASNSAGSSSTTKLSYITVSSGPPPTFAPVANFSASPTSGIVPLTVNFTDLSTNTPTGWAWDFENNGSTDSTSQNPSKTYNVAGVYTVKLTASNGVGSDSETKVSYITVSSPAATSYYPLSTGTVARADDYNYIQGIINDVMGLNPNGYGIPWLYSSPVNTGTRLTAKQWNDLKLDVNTAYLHITNTETATFTFLTSTNVASIPGYDLSTATLSVPKHNLLAEAADYILANRYTCHPLQYFTDEGGNISRIGGVSSRTEAWGLGPDIEIYHTVHAVFATQDTIRYFFNAGGVLNWAPGWTQEAQSDIDLAWQGFINYWLTNLNYEYNRTDFLTTGTKTTNYNSGTLQMSVVAGKTTSGTFANREIVFTATYRNTDIGSLVVVPVTGVWDYQLP